jgi:queuine tRNA-ribosyltransferase
MAWAARSKTHFEQRKGENPWGKPPSAPGAHGAVAEGFVEGVPPTARWAVPDVPLGAVPSLFGIVQGGMYLDLRRESAERLVEMDFPGYAIGGLAVGEPRERTIEMIAATLAWLPKDKPRYVMGVGYPEEIAAYAAIGVDMMDCTIPTRVGRHGQLFTSEGRLNIKNKRFAEDQGPLDPECSCPVCARYTRAYLRHLFSSGEPLAGVLNSLHNLAFYLDTMRRVRAGLVVQAEAPSAPESTTGTSYC